MRFKISETYAKNLDFYGTFIPCAYELSTIQYVPIIYIATSHLVLLCDSSLKWHFPVSIKLPPLYQRNSCFNTSFDDHNVLDVSQIDLIALQICRTHCLNRFLLELGCMNYWRYLSCRDRVLKFVPTALPDSVSCARYSMQYT